MSYSYLIIIFSNISLLNATYNLSHNPIVTSKIGQYATLEEQLLWAVKQNEIFDVIYLINHNADINTTDMNGNAPLSIIIKEYRNDFIKYNLIDFIIRHKADINAQNLLGETPLMIATKLGYIFIVKMLLRAHANQKLKNQNNQTALEIALNKLKTYDHNSELYNTYKEIIDLLKIY